MPHAEKEEEVAHRGPQRLLDGGLDVHRYAQVGERGAQVEAQGTPVEAQRIDERAAGDLPAQAGDEIEPFFGVTHGRTLAARTAGGGQFEPHTRPASPSSRPDSAHRTNLC